MNDQPYVVILTGGARPDDPAPDPAARLTLAVPDAVDAALDAITPPGGTLPAGAAGAVSGLADAAWRDGWRECAKRTRVVQAWVIAGKDTAERFAGFVSEAVDPAFVTRAADPLDEVLRVYELPDAEVVDE